MTQPAQVTGATWPRPRIVRSTAGLVSRLDARRFRRLMVVADACAAQMSGADALLAPALASRQAIRFEAFSPYPKLAEVLDGLRALTREPVDALVAIGGGSAIDAAKLIAIAAGEPVHAEALLTGRRVPTRPALPVVAVPTTAGTGAEATRFAAIYLDTGKASVAHNTMRPALALLEPRLTASMSPRLTAETGLDALCQGIESLWSVRSTPESARFALRALRLAWRHLPSAVLEPTVRARRAMATAAYLAGRAIDISTTTACHALSYELSRRFGVAHGHAVALSMPAMLRHNAQLTDADCADPRGATHTRSMIDRICREMGASDADAAAARFSTLLDQLGCARSIRDRGATVDDIPSLVLSVNPLRLANNPRRLDSPALHHIYGELMRA